MEKEKVTDETIDSMALSLWTMYGEVRDSKGLIGMFSAARYVVIEVQNIAKDLNLDNVDKKDLATRLLWRLLPKYKWMPQPLYTFIMHWAIESAVKHMKKFTAPRSL